MRVTEEVCVGIGRAWPKLESLAWQLKAEAWSTLTRHGDEGFAGEETKHPAGCWHPWLVCGSTDGESCSLGEFLISWFMNGEYMQ